MTLAPIWADTTPRYVLGAVEAFLRGQNRLGWRVERDGEGARNTNSPYGGVMLLGFALLGLDEVMNGASAWLEYVEEDPEMTDEHIAAEMERRVRERYATPAEEEDRR
jgi:hypothetical protein